MSTAKNQETTQIAYAVEAASQPQTTDIPNNSVKLRTKRQVQGAAVAGGVTGLVLLGPVVGLVAAGGAALATSGKGEIGNAARATGDSVSDLGNSMKKFEKKHHIKKKTSKGIVKGCNWISNKLNKDKGPKITTQTE